MADLKEKILKLDEYLGKQRLDWTEKIKDLTEDLKKGVNLDGRDYDHKRQSFVSVKSNRGNEGQGTRQESGANYNTD